MKHFVLAAVMALAPLTATATPLGPFTEVLVFGDSLSDAGLGLGGVGNPIYPDAQYTNGDSFATQLGADLASGLNFAVGGATAVSNGGGPDFTEQRIAYETAAPTLGDNPLAIVWFGGNDLRAATPSTAASIIGASVGSIVSNVNALIGSGLENVLVFGLPNLGALPAFENDPAGAFGARILTENFNAALTASLAAFTPPQPLANVQYFDTFALFESILANSDNLGFTNTTQACVVFNPDGSVASSCAFPDPAAADSYVFYDGLHPTEPMHTLIADAVHAQVAPIPLPAGGVLLLAAVGGLALTRRRRMA